LVSINDDELRTRREWQWVYIYMESPILFDCFSAGMHDVMHLFNTRANTNKNNSAERMNELISHHHGAIHYSENSQMAL